MIQEEKISLLSQLISTMKESIDSLESAIESKDQKEILGARDQIIKINQEIKENLKKLKS
jgi:hypothetical protein